VIKSFNCRETERLLNNFTSRKFPGDILRRARRKLEMLDASKTLEDLRVPPSNYLEKLSGNRKGQYSIRVNRQWRICFVWKNGDVYDVEIVDYH